jgi:hypothetical protein
MRWLPSPDACPRGSIIGNPDGFPEAARGQVVDE